MICCALALRSSRGFSVMNMRPVLRGAAAAADRHRDAGDIGIGLHDRAELFLAPLHVGKGNILIGLGGAR